MIYYKIRSKKNPELFRKADGSWNGSGKVYDTLGKLRSVITYHMNSYNSHMRDRLNDWEIVEYEVRVREVKQLHEIVDPKKIWGLLSGNKS